jgi:ribose transport system substrate-binding protein
VKRKTVPVGAVAILVALVGAGCGTTASPSATSVASATAAGSAPGATTSSSPSASPKKLSLGIITFSGTDDATNQVVNGAKAEAAALGWDVTFNDANGSVDQANSQMQNLVSKKVDAIIVTIFPTAGLGAGLAATQAAGIPVLSEGGGLSAGVAVDFDISLGQPVFDAMIASLGSKGDVLNLTYHGGRPCFLRAEMFKENQAKYPDLKVTTQEFPVPGFAEASVAATNAWLAANPADPNVKYAIFSCFDGSALAAISALKTNGRTGVEVYSFNGTGPALTAIRSGDMTASMWVDFTGLGKTMTDLVPTILAPGGAWQPKTLPADSLLVNKGNLDQFLKDHPEAAAGG